MVVHTAKNVEYNITGFRNKNKDEVSKESSQAILSSKNEIIVNIFQVFQMRTSLIDLYYMVGITSVRGGRPESNQPTAVVEVPDSHFERRQIS